jgi:hypothetical protein
MRDRLHAMVVEYKRADQGFVNEHAAYLNELSARYPDEVTSLKWAKPCLGVPDRELFARGGIAIKYPPSSDLSGLGPQVRGSSPSPSAQQCSPRDPDIPTDSTRQADTTTTSQKAIRHREFAATLFLERARIRYPASPATGAKKRSRPVPHPPPPRTGRTPLPTFSSGAQNSERCYAPAGIDGHPEYTPRA